MEVNGCLDWSEILTALGSTRPTVIAALTQRSATAHPFIPTIFLSEVGSPSAAKSGTKTVRFCRDADFTWDALEWSTAVDDAGSKATTSDDDTKVTRVTEVVAGVLKVVADVASGIKIPKAQARGSTHFQIFRGMDGHSV